MLGVLCTCDGGMDVPDIWVHVMEVQMYPTFWVRVMEIWVCQES